MVVLIIYLWWILLATVKIALGQSLPIVVQSSGFRDGPDGPWASFTLNVNSNSEGRGGTCRNVPGLSLPFTLVPLTTIYCNGSHGRKANCPSLPGNSQPNASTTWSPIGSTDALSAVGLADLAIDKGTAQPYALMNVGLGYSEDSYLVLANGMVAGTDSRDFTVALFPLSNMEVNFGGISTKLTFLASAANDNVIESVSFSYTVGSFDRNNETASVPPSLALGGYDQSRPDSQTTMKAKVRSALSIATPYQFAVSLASISLRSGNTSEDVYKPKDTALSDTTLPVYIDSVTPYLWLPQSACEVFERAFRLTWIDASQFYIMNSSTHDWFLQTRRIVTSSLSSSRPKSDIKNFTLSSSSFDLRATWPLVENGSFYFSLKRASNTYILGRVFLQDTHISVDYERGYFNLSQSTPWTGQKEDLITIANTTLDQYTAMTTDTRTVRLSSVAYAGSESEQRLQWLLGCY